MTRRLFVMMCYQEPTAQVAWSIARLQGNNPGANVLLVADKPETGSFQWIADTFGVGLVGLNAGPLKRTHHGGRWIHEWMQLALQRGGAFEQLIKLDPDTLVRGPIFQTPGTMYFGEQSARVGLPIRNLGVCCHSAVGFSRHLVEQLVRTKEYLDPRFVNGSVDIRQKLGSDIASEEILTAWVLRELGVPATTWPAVRNGAHRWNRDYPGATCIHPVVPFQPGKVSLGTLPRWYRDLLISEARWFRATHGSRCPSGVLE